MRDHGQRLQAEPDSLMDHLIPRHTSLPDRAHKQAGVDVETNVKGCLTGHILAPAFVPSSDIPSDSELLQKPLIFLDFRHPQRYYVTEETRSK